MAKIKIQNVILGLLLLGGGYYFYKRYAASGQLQYGKPTLKNIKLDGFGVSFDVNWPIINPTQTPLTVADFVGGVYWGQYLLSTLKLANPVVIAGGGASTPLVFKTSVQFAQVAGNFQQAVVTGDWLRNIFFKGTLTAEGLRIGIDQPLLT